MSPYKMVKGGGDGRHVYVTGAALRRDTKSGLDEYKKFLDGNYAKNSFRDHAIRGLSFELNDQERLRMVLFEPVPLNGVPFIIASAYALTDKASEEMLEEFRKITGFPEMDVPDGILDFYKNFDENAVKKKRRFI